MFKEYKIARAYKNGEYIIGFYNTDCYREVANTKISREIYPDAKIEGDTLIIEDCIDTQTYTVLVNGIYEIFRKTGKGKVDLPGNLFLLAGDQLLFENFNEIRISRVK